MLSTEVFNLGIQELEFEYKDRGFVMTKKRSLQWYEFMKNMSNEEFKKKIRNCLMTCRKVPFMADVLNLKEGDTFGSANAGAYEYV